MERLGLGKLLEAMYAAKPRVRKLVRDDIRQEAKKSAGVPRAKGGDFYVPFWADAKAHAAGQADLRKQSLIRIAQLKGRERIFTQLTEGFLRWWEEKRRYRNEPVSVEPSPSIPPLALSDIGVVKIENTLAINVEGDGPRLLYPYFRPEPPLCDEAARVALWALLHADTGMPPTSLRILDVCRGRSFSLGDTPLRGDEERLLCDGYAKLLDLRAAMLAEKDDDLAA